MRVVAVLLSLWAAWRWVGFAVGAARIRRFQGPPRREVRRSVAGRGAVNVFWSVAAFYAWAMALGLQPAEHFVGFLAALLMVSLLTWVAMGFMQPAERTPETLDIFRLRLPAHEAPADVGEEREHEEPGPQQE